MSSHQNKRREIVKRVINTLKELKAKGFDFNDRALRERLINEICLEYGASHRTAMEYFNNALTGIELYGE